MPYLKDNSLISRKGYSGFGGLGGFFDTVGDVIKGAVTFYGDSRAAAAAGTATTPVVPVAVDTGVSTTTLVVGGLAVAGLAIVLLKKKKS